MNNLQIRTWEIVELARPGDKPSWYFDVFIISLIFLNIVSVILQSVQPLDESFGYYFNLFEGFSVAIFSFEYLARLWACTVSEHYKSPIKGRIKFVFSPMAVIDLIAIVPFFLPFIGYDLRTLRAFRLFRILRLAKAGRYLKSLKLIQNVVYAKRQELTISLAFLISLLVVSSTVLFFCENPVQPDKFSSIPATMWWAIATLTTVGYGDMCPVTPIGKVCASFFAILGVCMFALPTGILGSGFAEEVQKRNEKAVCPHCKKEID